MSDPDTQSPSLTQDYLAALTRSSIEVKSKDQFRTNIRETSAAVLMKLAQVNEAGELGVSIEKEIKDRLADGVSAMPGDVLALGEFANSVYGRWFEKNNKDVDSESDNTEFFDQLKPGDGESGYTYDAVDPTREYMHDGDDNDTDPLHLRDQLKVRYEVAARELAINLGLPVEPDQYSLPPEAMSSVTSAPSPQPPAPGAAYPQPAEDHSRRHPTHVPNPPADQTDIL